MCAVLGTYLREVGYPSGFAFISRCFCVFWGVLCDFSIVGLVCIFWHFSLVFLCDEIYSFLHSIVAFVGDI